MKNLSPSSKSPQTAEELVNRNLESDQELMEDIRALVNYYQNEKFSYEMDLKWVTEMFKDVNGGMFDRRFRPGDTVFSYDEVKNALIITPAKSSTILTFQILEGGVYLLPGNYRLEVTLDVEEPIDSNTYKSTKGGSYKALLYSMRNTINVSYSNNTDLKFNSEQTINVDFTLETLPVGNYKVLEGLVNTTLSLRLTGLSSNFKVLIKKVKLWQV